MKNFIFSLILLCLSAGSLFAQLNPGDIAIIQYNADNTDNIAFLALTDMPAGEIIYFTDNGWLATNSWRTGEGIHTYTAPTGGISCGDIVTVTLSGPALSGSGDQIIAYQNASDMIFGLNSEGAHIWQADATSSNTSAVPQGLTNTTNAVALTEIDNAIYTGSTTGTKAQILSWICDYSNWAGDNSTNQTFSGSFTISDCGVAMSNTITTGLISTPPFSVDCLTGVGGSVVFTSTDPFISNTYTAELSDASGDFSTPTNIGTLVSDANSGTINFVIPAGTPTGSGYLIRVVSNSPVVTDTSSTSFTVTLTGGPCSCFEIESILVDACDSGWEGENEMFRFSVGGSPIDINDILVNWPSNSWLGIVQNATTASIVSNINGTITGGGLLIEPPGGIIPASAQVMFFTSTDFTYSLFDFSALNYDLYAIFQDAGNTAGHFVNYSSTSKIRTLEMDVSGCGGDTVTYDAQYVYDGDGGTVNFDIPGNPTYLPTGNCSSVPINLPIELLYFDSYCDNNIVELKWATSSETNNDYFTIEKSSNAIDFYDIASIQGAGNSNIEIRYQTVDDKPLSGITYYRLRQTDFDGSYSYSDIETVVNCSSSELTITQPFSNYNLIHFNVYNADGKSVVEIYDITGRLLFKKEVFISDNTVSIPNIFSKGAYVLKFTNQAEVKIRKFVL